METEKAERENMAKAVASKSASSNTSSSTGSYGLLQGLVGPTSSVPSLSAGLGTGLLASQ